MVNRITVRLRGSGELMRGLYNRDLSYTVDLAGVSRGANVISLDVATMPDFRAYEVMETIPGRLILEMDALVEKVIPLEADMPAVPEESSFRLSNVQLEPAAVTIKGAETRVRSLDRLTVFYDPNQDLAEGTRALKLAIAVPDHVDISPPVATLRYTLSQKTRQVQLTRVVQLGGGAPGRFSVSPPRVSLAVELPENRLDDAAYQAAIRVVARLPENTGTGRIAEVPVLAVLPAGARLIRVEPSQVRIVPLLQRLPGPEGRDGDPDPSVPRPEASPGESVPEAPAAAAAEGEGEGEEGGGA
jgi:hypothetical protein